jgi:hypothetical protein
MIENVQNIFASFLCCNHQVQRARGGAVVKALRHKPEGRGIDSRWCQNFSLT